VSTVRIPLWGKPQGFATIDTEATKGATVGVNLFWADGTKVVAADFNPAPAQADPNGAVSRTLWSLIADVPVKVTALAVASGTTGLFAVTGVGTGALRSFADVANRITWTNRDGVAGPPAADIAATYVGQSSITTLGTVTAGAWNAGIIPAPYGGTGQAGYTIGDVLYASGTAALSKLAAGTSAYVLTANGAGVAPSWQAATSGSPDTFQRIDGNGDLRIDGNGDLRITS
jgi:hypothetical protein